MLPLLLITPKPDGVDRIQVLMRDGKGEVTYNRFARPITVDGHRVIGWVDVNPYAMTRHGGADYHNGILLEMLMRHLQQPELIDGDLYHTWRALAIQGELEGKVTTLLLGEDNRVRLFTFDTDEDLTVLDIDEPTLCNQGMILTKAALLEQMVKIHEERVAAVHKGFLDSELTASIDLINI